MKINLTKFNEDFKDKVSPLQSSLPKVIFYEMDLSSLASKQEEMVTDTDLNASFTKACTLNTSKDGLRSPGFWEGFYTTMVGNHLDLNMEGFALSNSVGSTNCIMQFLPGSCTKVAAALIATIARAHIGKLYDVVLLNGDFTTNQEAEGMALDSIFAAEQEGRKVWFISQAMGSRSFSVPEIDAVLLTFDGGDLHAIKQKLSRALTKGSPDKIGKIVSCSIDPNREDKVAKIILEAAVKASEEGDETLRDSLSRAYGTFPLFSVDSDGCQIKLTEDEYIERAMSLDSSISMSVNRSKLCTLDEESARSLADQCLQIYSAERRRLGVKEAIQKGKRFISEETKPTGGKKKLDPWNILAQQLDHFVHNLEYISYFVDEDRPQLSEILEVAESNESNLQYFIEFAGMTPSTIQSCISSGLLRTSQVDSVLLQYASKVNQGSDTHFPSNDSK